MGREWLHNKVIVGAMIGSIVTHSLWLALDQPTQTETIEAYELGKRHALRTNPVSMDLEMTCVSLWVGKQTPNL
jgi:hypothetical protein